MDKKSVLESLLFTAGEPVKIKKLASIAGLNDEEVMKHLKELAADYEIQKRGLCLILHNDHAQLASVDSSAPFIEKMIKSDFEEDLSQAALETLAIIAYCGPASRAEVENIRGVNCSFILRALAIRGLVERKENPDDHRSHLYQVSFEFLRHLGLSKLEDLPEYSKFMKHET